MLAIKGYLQRWHLKLSIPKTHCFYLYFSNKEADYDLDIHVDDKTLPHSKYPVYLGVELQQHTKVLHCKVTARTSLLRCLAGTSWGTSGSTLCTGAMTIVLSAAEYACPVWCHSSHAQKLDMMRPSGLCLDIYMPYPCTICQSFVESHHLISAEKPLLGP